MNCKDRLGECPKAFWLVDCQIGAAFAVIEGVVALECFGYQRVFGKFFTKLVAAGLEALDGLDESEKTQVPSESVRHSLEGGRKAPGKSQPSLGLGENIRFEDDSVSVASLVHDGRGMHLSAFSHNGHKNDVTRVLFKWFFSISR